MTSAAEVVDLAQYNFERSNRVGPEAGDKFREFNEACRAGESAPDFTLPKLDGGQLALSELRGKPVVLEFGSITCPPCQAEFSGMDEFAREYADRAHFVFIYTREAHPEWDPEFPPHRSMEQKLEHAKIMQERHQSPRTIAVDALDGPAHHAYGMASNMSFLVDHGGRIAYKASWTIAEDLRWALERQFAMAEAKRRGHVTPYFKEMLDFLDAEALRSKMRPEDVERLLKLSRAGRAKE